MENSGKIKKPRRSWKIALALLISFFFVLIIVGLWKFGSVLAFIWLFHWAANRIAESTGANIWLARFIAVPLAVFFLFAIWRLLSWDAKKKRQGIILFASGAAVIMFGMFWMEKDFIFNADGTSAKCYAATPTGYECVPCTWKVHRLYGTPVRAYTKEMAMSKWLEKSGLTNIERIVPTRDLRFFSNDGTPLVWYYQYPDGRLEFFSQSGFHPQFGNVALLPVDGRIIALLFDYLEQKKFEMIILNSGKTIPDPFSKQTVSTNGGELEKLRNVLADLQVK